MSRSPASTVESSYADALAARAPLEATAPPAVASVLERAEAQPTEEPNEQFLSPVERIAIKSIGVDSQLVPLNITPDGYMDVPNSPELVAWYDFTSKPGLGGNAVFSGHVDYHNYGPAVFWDLRNLEAGDEIEIVLRDGTVIHYAVTALQSFPVDNIDMAAVLAPTAQESITLITCDGIFDAGHYDQRLVVRAVRTTAEGAS